MSDITTELKTIFSDRLKENESLAKHTTWRIGGPARWLVEAKRAEEIQSAVRVAEISGVKFLILGGGSNVLVNDSGFAGLVIRPALREIKVEGNLLTAEAGAPVSLVSRAALENNLSGLEWMITLPGTIGGAVRGNAGCFGCETGNLIKNVKLLRDGKIEEVAGSEMNFNYRNSLVKQNRQEIILSAAFELVPGDSATIKSKMDELLAKRLASQPPAGGTAGCVFKNYVVKNDEFDRLKNETDIPNEMLAKKIISAGWLIDQMDLKGKQIGGAKISEKHANFIENVESATASDVVQLIALVKMKARDRFGIQLEEEVEYVGF
ncbi:MAG: UDP-N-acetylmuramate dehydrogenase [Candidatus Uhrbacteria bacterium]